MMVGEPSLELVLELAPVGGRFGNVAALEQALDQGGRLGQLAGAGETGRLGHSEGNSVGHVEAFQCCRVLASGAGAVDPLGSSCWRQRDVRRCLT